MPPIRLSWTIIALMGAFLRWRAHRLARAIEAGRTNELRCWLRGDAPPYPAALHGGRVVAEPGEPVRFVSPTAPAGDVTLPAGGLRPVTARALVATDGLRPAFPLLGRTFAVLSGRDSAGGRVDVVVPDPLRVPATALLHATAGAPGPDEASVSRTNSWARRLVGRWTASVLLALAIGAGIQAAVWWEAERITGIVAQVRPKTSGRGSLCLVDWRDPWTSEQRRSEIACPSGQVGAPIEGLARPGGRLAHTGARVLGWFLLGIGLVFVVPEISYRGRLALAERAARRRSTV